MAVVLQYSTDRGANWTAFASTDYTHPTTAGVYPIHIKLGGLFKTSQHTVRFRLYGTDAANWGLYQWALEAPDTIKKDRENV
jgi:hypothetical protein